MEKVHTPLLLLGIVFLSFVASSDGRIASDGKHEAGSKGEDEGRVPFHYPYPGDINGYPRDRYRSLASMYFPDSEAGFQGMGIGKDGHGQGDGLRVALDSYGGYPQGYYGNPPFGYGYPYPYPGSVFGFPGSIFGFPGSIFRFPRGLFGFPLGSRGFPGGYGGFPGGYPGGYGGFPGGYGGYPGGSGGYGGGYGGNPGGYGGGKPGDKPGGPGYPGYGAKTEAKGKEVNHHD